MIPLPSNVQAIEAGLRFSLGYESFVALVGPTGWGKTHLLESVNYGLANSGTSGVPIVSALDWLNEGVRHNTVSPVLLDDVQEVLNKPKLRSQLKVALERRVKGGKRTMLSFTSPKPSRSLLSFLPLPREWSVASIREPEPIERRLLISHMAEEEKLLLSTALVELLAYKMHGNGLTLVGALKRLRHAGGTWLDARGTLRACALLDPFFTDNPDWDLRDRILRVSGVVAVKSKGVSREDLAAFTMSQAGICEAEVSRVMGLDPAEVYLCVGRFSKRWEECDTARAAVAKTVEAVVDGLLQS